MKLGRLSRAVAIVGLVMSSIAPSAVAATATAGQILISEFRVRGPNGANDEYIELYNNSGADHTVQALSGSGYGIAASDGVTRCSIPNGTVIPNRGHYLCVNSVGYSLASYPAGNGTTATGDATYTTDIPDNAGIAIFNNNSGGASYSLANRLDAVGSTSEANTLYKEGTGYPALVPFSIDYAFYRDDCGKSGSITTFTTCTITTPKDSDNNAADFVFVDTNGTSAGAGQRLGAPGPQNLSSPIHAGTNLGVASVDTCVAQSSPPNNVRDFTSDPANNSTFGTLDVRLNFTNNTGASLTRLRFRVVDLTTFPAPSGIADLRPRTSTDVIVTVDRPPCASGTSNITVRGTTLEQPPSQPNGGGFNSSFSVGAVTLGTPLANGASIDVRFLLGIQQTGSAKLGLIPEGLGPTGPVTGDVIYLTGSTDAFATIPVTIEQAAGQSDPASTEPINFTVTFNEPVTGFATGDVTLGGTTGATTAIVTGGPSVYNVAVSGVTSNGTLTASIAAGVASGSLGSLNQASTSVDNSVDVALVTPPSIAKVFNPATIPLNATTSLTFAITNPTSTALTGVAVADTLPAGLIVANAAGPACGGTLTTTAPTGIALSGATINGNGQCQFSVTVTGAAAGSYVNTTGNVTSTNGGTGNTATANLTVGAPATITKAFGASQILLNGTTSLTFTVANPNAALTLTGIAFTDTLPAGLMVATPSGLTGTCGGGTITATQNTNTIALSGASLPGSASCNFSVNVTGIAAGAQNNTTGNVSSTEGGTGGTASAAVTVVAPPSIASAFNPATIVQGSSTTLTFTLANPPGNTVALTGVGFTDTLPSGLSVATPNGMTGSCGGGTIAAASGTDTIALSGATLPINGTCTFSVAVNAALAGTPTNTTGSVTSANGGTGGTASAQLTVTAAAAVPIPTLSQWALMAVSALMMLVALGALRRQRGGGA